MKMALPSTMRVQNQARDGRAKDGQREITRTGRVGRVDRLVVGGTSRPQFLAVGCAPGWGSIRPGAPNGQHLAAGGRGQPRLRGLLLLLGRCRTQGQTGLVAASAPGPARRPPPPPSFLLLVRFRSPT